MTAGMLRADGAQLVATGFDDALALWDALDIYFLQRRPMRAGFFSLYPDTTVGDVQQAAQLLAGAADKLPKDAMGRADTIARWKAYRDRIAQQSSGRRVTDAYPDNDGFWTESRRIAVDISTASKLPTKGDQLLDAVKDTITAPVGEVGILDTVANAWHAGADYVERGAKKAEEAADAAAGKAQEIAKGLAGGAHDAIKDAVKESTEAFLGPLVDKLGKPVLIGAAVVGGVLLVPKLLELRKPTRRVAS